jgi:hypothetical protein
VASGIDSDSEGSQLVIGRVRSWFLRLWWFGVLLFGFAVAIGLEQASARFEVFGLHVVIESPETILSLCGLWLAICLWFIAGVDLVVGVIRARRGLGFIVLPGNVPLPNWILPGLVPIGFLVGMTIGHLWW